MTTKYISNIYMLRPAFWAILLGVLAFGPATLATQYNLSKGTVSFTLPAPIGELLATNSDMKGTLETSSGALNFTIAVGGFRFITAAMPDHINEATTKRFNDYYLETEKFPNASFKGQILDAKKINFSKEGTYNVKIKGAITIHGQQQEIWRDAAIVIKGGNISLKSVFTLSLSDYQVRVPEVVRDVFFKEVTVAVDCQLR